MTEDETNELVHSILESFDHELRHTILSIDDNAARIVAELRRDVDKKKKVMSVSNDSLAHLLFLSRSSQEIMNSNFDKLNCNICRRECALTFSSLNIVSLSSLRFS